MDRFPMIFILFPFYTIFNTLNLNLFFDKLNRKRLGAE